MVQIPGSDGWFLATQEFYSPNDSANAKIVLVRPECGNWKIQIVKELPFCHRFSIITRNDVHYLICCTLKSAHAYKDDWSVPGAIYVGELPGDIENYHLEHQLELTLLEDGLLKNHGYATISSSDGDYSLIGTENGVYKVIPPANRGAEWTCEQIVKDPVSDMVLCDFDQDGEDEMLVISPFHGDQVSVYKKTGGTYQLIWKCPFLMPMAHAIWSYPIYGKNTTIIGYRKGNRDLVEVYYEAGEYKTHVLAADVGAANVYLFEENDIVKLVAANRETNEIAFYAVEIE